MECNCALTGLPKLQAIHQAPYPPTTEPVVHGGQFALLEATNSLVFLSSWLFSLSGSTLRYLVSPAPANPGPGLYDCSLRRPLALSLALPLVSWTPWLSLVEYTAVLGDYLVSGGT